MVEKLKSCPFCGSNEAELFYPSEYRTGANNRDWYIQCFDCNVETAEYLTVEEAIAAWNTRAPADLRSALEAIATERWSSDARGYDLACEAIAEIKRIRAFALAALTPTEETAA
jgi:Lar family restriction alleviation protein